MFVLDGAIRMEFGPGGREVLDAGPGDFLHVPKHAIHREGNTLDQESHVIVVRTGEGPPTINVDGPEPRVSHRAERHRAREHETSERPTPTSELGGASRMRP